MIFSTTLFAQDFQKKIEGQVISDSLDVNDVHVMNISTNISTITDVSGRFHVEVKLNDTLLFSAIQYQLKRVIISSDEYIKGEILIKLDEKINKLSEVVVSPHNLSGNLAQDIKNINTDDVFNGAILGLPNATVTVLTQSERKLYTATDWNFEYNKVKLDPIINAITGRTKMLKKRVDFEEKVDFTEKIIKDFGKYFFTTGLQIPEDRIQEFLNFSSSHERFLRVVKSGNAFELTNFLEAMAGQFLKQLNEKE